MSFARRGMVPHAGDPFFLPRVLPFHRLNEAALLPDSITSETLARVGCGEPARARGAGRGDRGRPRCSASRPGRRAASGSRSGCTADRSSATWPPRSPRRPPRRRWCPRPRDRMEGVEVAHRGPATRLHGHLTPVALLDGLRRRGGGAPRAQHARHAPGRPRRRCDQGRGSRCGRLHALGRMRRSAAGSRSCTCAGTAASAASSIDLRTPEGADVFRDLVDVRAKSWSKGCAPARSTRRGLGYDALSAQRTPPIVFCSLSGFGQTGPYRDLATHGVAYDAYAGHAPPETTDDGFPTIPRGTSTSAPRRARSTPRSACSRR